MKYPIVYTVGARDVKKIDSFGSPNNHGYDDGKGQYSIVLRDHLAYRFLVCEKLGRGGFGQVVKAYDFKLQVFVAIKIIGNKGNVRFDTSEMEILKEIHKHVRFLVVFPSIDSLPHRMRMTLTI